MNNDDHREADALMEAIAKGPSLTRSLIIAVVVHVILIGVLSIPYLLKAASYGTLDVRRAAEAEMQAADEAARSKQSSERQAETRAKGPGVTPAKGLPKEERTQPREPSKGEVSGERPSDSGLNVDEDFGL